MPVLIHPKTLHIDKRAEQLLRVDEAIGQDDDLLTTKEVAQWFGISYQTLEIARHRGSGSPPFIRMFGRVRYRRSDVISWLQERQHTGTAAYRRNGAGADNGPAPKPKFRRGN